jgi:hypothetical protein
MFGDGTDPIGNPITVTGTKAPAPPPVTGPEQAATPAGTPVQSAEPKKKHIWQDILGAIGDGLSVQGHGQATYAPFKQKRDIGDAMQGFDKDPMGTIKQVSKLDPALGERMLNNYQENEIRKDGQAYIEMRAKRDDDLKRQEYEDKTFGVAFTMLGNPNIEKSYGKVRPQIMKYLEARGIAPEKAGLPEVYDKDTIDSLYSTTKRSMDEEKQASLDDYRARMLGLRGQRLQQTGANTESQIADRNTDNARQAGDSEEKGRHNLRTEEISASKGKGGRRPPPAIPGAAAAPSKPEGRAIKGFEGLWAPVNGKLVRVDK